MSFLAVFKILRFPLKVLKMAVVPFFFFGARAFMRRLLFGVDGGARPGHIRVCALTFTTFLHTMILLMVDIFFVHCPLLHRLDEIP